MPDPPIARPATSVRRHVRGLAHLKFLELSRVSILLAHAFIKITGVTPQVVEGRHNQRNAACADCGVKASLLLRRSPQPPSLYAV
jgi:hypothetical protein